MKILLNGKEYQCDKEISISKLVEERGLRPESLVIELNNQIIKRETWNDVFIKKDDKLEILRFVGGG